MNISMFGSGAFAKALIHILKKNNHNITLHCHTDACFDRLQNVLSDVNITKSYENIADIAIFATPSYALVETASKLNLSENTIIVNATKGLNAENGLFSEFFSDKFPKNPYVVLTGPTHAEELILDIPSTILCASNCKKSAKITQDLFMTNTLRVYRSDDPIGAELGGAFKNIIAMACGACDGLNYGDNTKAALMTRGMAEITRLGIIMGANSQTFAGLSGIGDLIVTCTSKHSRNKSAGYLIGIGKTPAQAMEEVGAVVEGYYAAKYGIILKNKFNVDMPILDVINSVLYKNGNAKILIDTLLCRERKEE